MGGERSLDSTINSISLVTCLPVHGDKAFIRQLSPVLPEFTRARRKRQCGVLQALQSSFGKRPRRSGQRLTEPHDRWKGQPFLIQKEAI